MMLEDCVLQFFSEFGFTRTYVIGFSGGLDSQVLLSLSYELRKLLPLKLRALHINHGLSQKANKWAFLCKDQCKLYAIPYEEHVVHIECHKGNIEEKARNARYQVFAANIAEKDMLLTAHHQDDQAETMLLQLLRGAGPKGLAAMPRIKPFASGYHARPLLNFSRSALEEYAIKKRLKWVEDESNYEIKQTRNLIRLQILPKLIKHFPHAVKTLARSANNCAETQILLDDYAEKELPFFQGKKATTLSVSKLRLLSPLKQRLILRTWLLQLGSPLPDTKKMMTIQQQMFSAKPDRNPAVKWANVILRRYRDDLYLMPYLNQEKEPLLAKQYRWYLKETLTLPGVGVLQARLSANKGLHPNINEVMVRFRNGGEILDIPKRGHRALKQLFQEWGVKPWERDKIPLIYFEEKLIIALGYFIHPDYMVENSESGYELYLHREIPSCSL